MDGPFSSQATDLLSGLMREDGGFANEPGLQARADATAYGLMALRFLGKDAGLINRSAEKLVAWQESSGGIYLSQEKHPAIWPTALAVLAWTGLRPFSALREKALDFLLERAEVSKTRDLINRLLKNRSDDPDFAGWSWNDQTYSWVAPTSLALLALKASKLDGSERFAKASEMLLHRQLPSGGWNYGNTVIFDTELLPLADTTGMALCALAGHVDYARVAGSFGYLESYLKRGDSPLGTAWGVMACKAWGRPDPASGSRLLESLQKTLSLGVPTCESVSLLVISASVERGFPEALEILA